MQHSHVKNHVISCFLRLPRGEGICLLLSGQWGSGKTYFWKNQLKPLIEEMFPDEPIVYVSCFGLENSESFRSVFIRSFLGRFNETSFFYLDRLFILFSSLIGLIFRTLIQLISGIDSGLKIDPIDMLSPGMIVVIDDIERRHPGISIEFILGFVSRLMSEKHARVLLICDEEKLGLNEADGGTHSREVFFSFKEKVVARSFSWDPKVEEILEVGLESLQIESGRQDVNRPGIPRGFSI